MSETAEKTLDITVQTAKMTAELLKEILQTFADGSSSKNYSGKVRYGELAKSGKLDSIEITENNIGDFLPVAQKYDVDFALKRDKSTDPPTYHVFFKTSDSENFNRAFKEYAVKTSEKIQNKAPLDREQIRSNAKIISGKKEKVHTRRRTRHPQER